MTDDLNTEMKVEIHDVSTEYKFPPHSDKPLFQVKKLSTSHERYGGGTHKFDWIVFERGDSVAVLVYNEDRKEVVLTRQFRAPTLKYIQTNGVFIPKKGCDGQLQEVIAGIPRDENQVECAIREVKEEAGYILKKAPELIATFYVSPGGTSERIYLYYAVVKDSDRDPQQKSNIGGVPSDAESILVQHIPLNEFYSQIEKSADPLDSKLLIASLILKERLGKNIPDDDKEQPADPAVTKYNLKNKPDLSIILRTGDIISSVRDVDAWVNPENTDMEMDRFIGKSISALIRYYGAFRDNSGRVKEDTIADALRAKMKNRASSRVGTVHDTTSGELRSSNNVKRIFHVAAVEGRVGQGTPAKVSDLLRVTLNSLEAIEKRSNTWTGTSCVSALLPMIGTGDQGLLPEAAFPEILKGVLTFFRAQEKPLLKTIHISAYSRHHAKVAATYLNENADLVLDSKQ